MISTSTTCFQNVNLLKICYFDFVLYYSTNGIQENASMTAQSILLPVVDYTFLKCHNKVKWIRLMINTISKVKR